MSLEARDFGGDPAQLVVDEGVQELKRDVLETIPVVAGSLRRGEFLRTRMNNERYLFVCRQASALLTGAMRH